MTNYLVFSSEGPWERSSICYVGNLIADPTALKEAAIAYADEAMDDDLSGNLTFTSGSFKLYDLVDEHEFDLMFLLDDDTHVIEGYVQEIVEEHITVSFWIFVRIEGI